jgi:chromosome segregation ATPase
MSNAQKQTEQEPPGTPDYKELYETAQKEISRLAAENGKAAKQLSALQIERDALKNDYTAASAALSSKEAEITKIKFDGKLDSALSAYKLHDKELVKGLLDVSRIKEDEKGALTGITEQIEALRGGKAFLFADSPPPKAGAELQNPGNQDGGDINDWLRSLK